jgi:hypothetical protein
MYSEYLITLLSPFKKFIRILLSSKLWNTQLDSSNAIWVVMMTATTIISPIFKISTPMMMTSKFYLKTTLHLHPMCSFTYICNLNTSFLTFAKTTLMYLDSPSQSHPFNTKGPLLIYNYINTLFPYHLNF